MEIFVDVCLYIGLAFLLIDIILSLILQLRICQFFLEKNDNTDFKEFQDTISQDGNWKDNIFELVNQKKADYQNEIELNNEKEDK